MRFAIKIVRLLALLAWLLLVGAASIPVSLRRDRWDAVKAMTGMIRIWGRGLLKIFNVKLELHGDHSAFKGGFVVSNHLGYLDIFVHSAALGFRFAPKSDVRGWPLLGRYIGLTHPVWIDRGSKQKSQEALDEFRETLRRGVSLIVYPEGTSTDGKSGVLPFKSTPFEAVMRDNLPIQPILTIYRVPEGCSATPCWYGDMTLLPHLWSLLDAPGFVAELHFLPQVFPEGRDRKALAGHVHSLIQREYERLSKAAPEPSNAVELEAQTL